MANHLIRSQSEANVDTTLHDRESTRFPALSVSYMYLLRSYVWLNRGFSHVVTNVENTKLRSKRFSAVWEQRITAQ